MDQVILVDDHDHEIGQMEKLEAHQKGLLHRAFSIFLFNDKGEMLIQQRAAGKYHSGGLWTNTCCSHQQPGETNIEAGKRRLLEEMGITTELRDSFSFIYRTDFDNGLVEHELDHVLIGSYNDAPNPDPAEAQDWKYISLKDLLLDVDKNPDNYTIWFKICLKQVIANV